MSSSPSTDFLTPSQCGLGLQHELWKEQRCSGQSKLPVGHTNAEGNSVPVSHRVGPWEAVYEQHPVG